MVIELSLLLCILVSLSQGTTIKDHLECETRKDVFIKDMSMLQPNEIYKFYSHSGYRKGQLYPKNFKCDYEFTLGDRCEKMTISCLRMDIRGDYSKICSGDDNLHFSDNFNTFQLRYCGNAPLPNITTDQMTVFGRFVSNNKNEGDGFECSAQCVQYNDGSDTFTTPATAAPTVDQTCKCGYANRRVRMIGGKETDKNEYPWQVAIVKAGTTNPFCGGTIVDDQWILTAAHCAVGFHYNDIQVVLGEHDHTNPDETDEITANVVEIINHGLYDPWTVNNDFSLLKIDQVIDFNQHKHIKPVCLPVQHHTVGAMATATGWGVTHEGSQKVSDVLQEIHVTVLAHARCQKLLYGELTPHMFCAGSEEGGVDTCQGDSGGPLVQATGRTHHLVGVTSWGYGCGRKGLPGVYADVWRVKNWIVKHIGDQVCQDPSLQNNRIVQRKNKRRQAA